VLGLRVMITGANGLLGRALRVSLDRENVDIIATGLGVDRVGLHDHIYENLDVTNIMMVNKLLEKYSPDIIVNAAAITNVDDCEIDKKRCEYVNCDSIDHFIEYAKNKNCHFIQISTDFVFNGHVGNYKESDTCDPINQYGLSKFNAEQKIIKSNINYSILRTSLLYSVAQGSGGFLSWLKSNLCKNKTLNLVDDQYRTPTLVIDLIRSIKSVAVLKKYGIFHITSGEELSIFDIASIVVDCYNFDYNLINKIQSDHLNQIAKRPKNSGLNISKARKELNFIPTNFQKSLN
jgi:dTDP-4-dehydrorhamnose reductase